MHSSSLVHHFILLEPEQFDEFRFFIRSEYFNRGTFREEIVVLLDILIQVYPDFSSEAIAKETVHEQLFPGKPFLKSRIEKVMSELNINLREFLLLSHYRREENTFQRNLDWAQLMRKKENAGRYELALEKLKKEQERDGKLSVKYYFENYLIQKEAHLWQIANFTGKDDINLVNTLDSLNNFYIIQGLDHLNSLLMTAKAIQIEIPPDVSSKFLTILSVTDHESNVLMKMHHLTTQLLQKSIPQMEDFRDYMQLLKTVEHQMSEEVLRDFYTYLRNFCTLITDSGYENLRQTLHEIQVECLNRGYFYFDGKITTNYILNITRMAVYVNNLEWLGNFLQEHRNRILGETENADYYRTNLALYLFAMKKYEDALEQLPTVNLKSVNYQITVKITEIKCYYELNSVLLSFKMEAFKVFLSRNTNKFLSNEQQFLCSKFITTLFQIVQCRKGDHRKINKIKERILAYKGNFYEQSWMFEKLDRLK